MRGAPVTSLTPLLGSTSQSEEEEQEEEEGEVHLLIQDFKQGQREV